MSIELPRKFNPADLVGLGVRQSAGTDLVTQTVQETNPELSNSSGILHLLKPKIPHFITNLIEPKIHTGLNFKDELNRVSKRNPDSKDILYNFK